MAAVREALPDVLAHEDAAGSDQAERMLLTLAAPGFLPQLIQDLLVEPGTIARVAGDSYRHALGFDKIVLMKVAGLGQLRLHVWWPDEQRHVEHIHNHRFGFTSLVVAGSIVSEFFQRASDGFPTTEFRESSIESNNQWWFDELGPTRLHVLSRVELAARSLYVLSAEALHRVSVKPGVLAFTIFLQTRLRRDWSSVFVDSGASIPLSRQQVRFSVPELQYRLSRLADALVNGGLREP
jgi:hypothetical protein